MSETKHLPNEQCTALIDFDVLCYRAAVSSSDLPEALDRFAERFDSIMGETRCGQYLGLFTPRGRENIFRYLFAPATYKANRPPTPELLIPLREAVAERYATLTGNMCEADDLLGIMSKGDTISVTNDKDDLTIPGRKYHFVRNEWYDISYDEAALNFYCQMLIGDHVDGIRGVDGIGKKKSYKALHGLTPDEMFEKVYDLYDDHTRFVINYNLLRMWRNQWELYTGREMGHDKGIILLNNYEEFRGQLDELLAELEHLEDLAVLEDFNDD